MKKLLFFAGAFALLVSCSKSEMAPEQTGANISSPGIVFSVASEDTKAELEINKDGEMSQFWYAEQDRIGIAAVNATSVWNPGTKLFTTPLTADWATNPALTTYEYKATKSMANGDFTAVNDANMLGFDANKVAKFVPFYPSNLAIASVAAVVSPAAPAQLNTTIPAIGTQLMTELNGASAYNYMVILQDPAKPIAVKASKRGANEVNTSVGETIPLSMLRMNPVHMFKLSNYEYGNNFTTELDYPAILGDLVGVTIETETNKINYDAASTMELLSGTTVYNYVADPDSKKIDLTIDAGLINKDGVSAFMVLPVVTRTAAERYGITWKFENGEISQPNNTSSYVNGTKFSWERHGMYMRTLDVESIGHYVTKCTVPGHTNKWVLTVNTKFEDGGIAPDSFGTTQTSPYEPRVDVKELILPEYTFTDLTGVYVRDHLIRNYLVKADLRAVKNFYNSMDSRVDGLKFEGFTNIKELTIGEAAIEEGAFRNCASLEKINLDKVTKIGKEAFLNCVKLKGNTLGVLTINANPGEAAFKNTGATIGYIGYTAVAFTDNVKVIGKEAFAATNHAFTIDLKQVNTIGESAFDGSGITTGVNLEKVYSIGKNAFKDCENMEGQYEARRNAKVMYIGTALKTAENQLKEIPESAFEGCKNIDIYDVYGNEVTIGDRAFYQDDRNGQNTVINFLANNVKIAKHSFINVVAGGAPNTWAQDGTTPKHTINFFGTLNGGENYTLTAPYTVTIAEGTPAVNNVITVTRVSQLTER